MLSFRLHHVYDTTWTYHLCRRVIDNSAFRTNLRFFFSVINWRIFRSNKVPFLWQEVKSIVEQQSEWHDGKDYCRKRRQRVFFYRTIFNVYLLLHIGCFWGPLCLDLIENGGTWHGIILIFSHFYLERNSSWLWRDWTGWCEAQSRDGKSKDKGKS